MEKAADVLDVASQISENFVSQQVAAITNRKRPERTEECIECGDPIPEARQLATGGTDHCIHCQALKDRKGK